MEEIPLKDPQRTFIAENWRFRENNFYLHNTGFLGSGLPKRVFKRAAPSSYLRTYPCRISSMVWAISRAKMGSETTFCSMTLMELMMVV